MNPLQQLSDYLRRIERNLRLMALARGSAVLFGAALLVTVTLVVIMNQLSFSDPSVFYSRLILFFILAAALSAALVYPLVRLNQKRAVHEAERRHPELGQRLLTFVERRNSNDPFLPLLASDSLPYTAAASPDAIAAPSRAMAFGSLAAAAAVCLLWLAVSGPGYFGYGTSLLWGVPKDESKPFYSVSVQPGNQRVRRHSDQIIAAQLHGFFSRQASLFVRYAGATRWEETAMRPQSDGAGFQFLLVGLPEDVDYYVVSNGIRSDTAKLTAVDLPQVTHIRVTYHFPRAYGRKDEIEDPGGDLRALKGTVADLDIETDRPLASGSITLDDGKRIDLSGDGRMHHASLSIEKDGAYHVATIDSGQQVRLSDDYFIEARPDSPPTVSILRPNRDARATPIEEVPVDIQAADDYGVNALELHYSVNGGPEQTRSVLNNKGAKEARGSALLSLEDFKLVPGDVVTIYATARDANSTSRSDIYFIEARPFELSYHQEQASGQGNGGAQDEPKIAERQKEIIAATYNQIKDQKRDAASESENAKYLSGVQAKLRDEAQSLSNRMKARQIAGSSTAFQQFVTNMESAVANMGPASDQLKGEKWHDALSPEQKALQYLLRAEAISRDIRVQISKGAGGGGGGGGASRDLEGLTSLELDTQKNQYESGSQSAADQKQKEADEALKKLEELAKRQQELAQQQQSKQNFQQRWEQEMLRREAEQLRQKLEQLAQNKQQGQQSPSQQQGEQGKQGQQGQEQSGRQSASGQQSFSGQQSKGSSGGKNSPATQQALEQALRNLSEAERQMSDAASHGDPSQAQRAAQQLNNAESAMSRMRNQQNGSEMGDMLDQARKLAARQKSFDDRLRHNFAGEASGSRSDQQNHQMESQMADEKRKEIDDLHDLEHAMQQAARGTQNTQPEASKKLRDAIGQMQQDELESRMKWTAEALNKGLGSYAVMREAPVTRELDELKDKLADAQQAMGANPDGKSGAGNDAMRQALARAEKLNRDLKAMAGQKPGQTPQTGDGQQPGQGQGQQSGQGQQPGSEPGSQSASQSGAPQGSRSGESRLGGLGPVGPAGSGSWNAMNFGGGPPPDKATAQREYEEAVREMSRLQQSVRSDPATAKDMADLLRQLQGLDPRRFNADPQKLAALEQQILADSEMAELILRRKLDDEHGSVRTTAPQNVPPGYSAAVAEYFRRLSH